MLASLRTKFLLPTYYVFSESFQQNVKSHVFLKSEKNEKYVFWNTDGRTEDRRTGDCIKRAKHDYMLSRAKNWEKSSMRFQEH